MRTAIAEAILKENSRKMNKLNKKITEISRRLACMKPTSKNKKAVRQLIEEVRANRDQYDSLQAEITALCYVEQFLEE